MQTRSIFLINFSLTCIAVFLTSIPLFAQTSSSADADPSKLTLTYGRDVTRSQISLGGEVAQLSSATASVVGVGPRVGFTYGLTDNWSFGANLDFAFGATGTPGAFLYSGLNGAIHYSIFGSGLLSTKHIRKSDGTDVITIIPSAKRQLAAMIGLEQLFLNGTTSIYPAVGYLVGGSYTFEYFNREFQVDFRYTSLMANNNPLTMMTVGAGMNFSL
jgi:hypothetical protein